MPKKILIVDDERDLLVMLKQRIESLGYEVLTAVDGVEGLTKARNLAPDLIILDIMMPKMDGYEVCRLLKFDEKYSFIPVIIFTCKTQEIDRLTAEKVGADEYIIKSFDIQDLLSKIKKHLED